MDDVSKTTENEDWTNRPEHLRQIADELDGDSKTPCTEAMILREAADEIEALRLGRTMPDPKTTPKTVRVRVRALVVIDSNGKWTITGDGQTADDAVRAWAFEASGDLGRAPWAEYWIEATVPLPVQPAGKFEAEVISDEQL